jgi:uncharacterized damage-inducible protein DinB
MNEAISNLKSQYQLILHSRKALIEYCKTLSNDDFLSESSSFGRGGSIRNLLVHIANTYEFWIIKHALKKDITFTAYVSKTSMDEIEQLFNSIDNEIYAFLSQFELSIFDQIDLEINGDVRTISAFELFTHVITHEFHHKGQILSLSRHLGYIPVDTDIIR